MGVTWRCAPPRGVTRRHAPLLPLNSVPCRHTPDVLWLQEKLQAQVAQAEEAFKLVRKTEASREAYLLRLEQAACNRRQP